MTFPQLISSHFERSIFFILVIAISLTMKGYCRAFAAWFNGPTPAQSTVGVSLLVLTLYTGYNIPEPSMIGALRWIAYINVRTSRHIHYTMTMICGCCFSH